MNDVWPYGLDSAFFMNKARYIKKKVVDYHFLFPLRSEEIDFETLLNAKWKGNKNTGQ